MAKEPYRSTNKKDFGEQMCRARDRKEKVRLFLNVLGVEGSRNLSTFGEIPPPFGSEQLPG